MPSTFTKTIPYHHRLDNPIINEFSKEASFIPEVWQGHKNNGEGFWIALEKLENLL
jgi:N-acetylneuraminate synthase